MEVQQLIDKADLIKGIRKRCIDMESDIGTLSKGCQFWKVRSDTGWYLRRLWLDMDRMCLRYVPSQKPIWKSGKTHVEVLAIAEVRQWSREFYEKILKKGYLHKRLDSPLSYRVCFTIVFNKQECSREYNLVAPDETTCDLWRTTLQKLISITRAVQHENQYFIWLKEQFKKADKDKTGVLTFKQVQELLERINIKPSRKYAKDLFNTVNVDKKALKGKQVLDQQEFINFFRIITKRSELKEIFEAYAETDLAAMTAGELQMFLSQEQFLNVDAESAKALILKHECSSVKQEELLTIAGFTSLMKSFGIANEAHYDIFQDMNQPLTEYYIASSHNTYLSGNQLTSKSSVQMYISALEQGCRCVEMDLWDGPDGDPVIYHGRTLTSQITLKDVLNLAIKPYAFKTSPYPLILSLECHLSTKQKNKLALYLKDILGELLYTTPVEDSTKTLPSPEELKGKIIVKAKKTSEISGDESETNDSDGDDVNYDSSNGGNNVAEPNQPVSQNFHKHQQTDKYDQIQETENPKTSVENEKHAVVTEESSLPAFNKNNIIHIESKNDLNEEVNHSGEPVSLSDLVNICQGIKFNGFHQNVKTSKCYHISSLSEIKAKKLKRADRAGFIQHTNNQLVRIYPKGSRTDSSNYNPVSYWNVGCQIVALNYQTNGLYKAVNDAVFQMNGSVGYVLKPAILRNPSISEMSETQSALLSEKVLRVKIISGQNLPKVDGEKKVIDPYVKVQILGHPTDKKKFKTKHVDDNGFNPCWEETTEFRLSVPEMDILVFSVLDKDKISDDEIIGYHINTVKSLRAGYGHISLTSPEGKLLPNATIFVHISICDLPTS